MLIRCSPINSCRCREDKNDQPCILHTIIHSGGTLVACPPRGVRVPVLRHEGVVVIEATEAKHRETSSTQGRDQIDTRGIKR